jgi:hypothetical protein
MSTGRFARENKRSQLSTLHIERLHVGIPLILLAMQSLGQVEEKAAAAEAMELA